MNKGTEIAGWDSPIITSRPRGSNFHIADRNGRAYLCNCCKRIKIGNRYIYGMERPQIWSAARRLLTAKLIWD
jgi:hypothetical protein